MQIKMTEDGQHAVLVDGKPVYIHPDGKETPFDVPDMYARLLRDGKRNSELQKSLEANEAKLQAFEGLDIDQAKKAIATLKNLDAKKLVDAGEVEKIRTETAKAIEEKFAPVLQERDTFKEQLFKERRTNIFANSKTLTEKLILPPVAAEKLFADQLREVDGKMHWHDSNGVPIYSRSNPGALADLEEGASLMLDAYPYKDHILKGTGNKGDGARGSNGGNGNNGAKTMTRDQFDALDPAMKSARMREGFSLTE